MLADRPDFRVVIASATMNSGIFHDFFRGAAQELKIPGRTYPIDILYAEGKDDIDVSPSVYVKAALAQTEEILAETEEGDILVFVATPADTDTLATQLRARKKEKRFILSNASVLVQGIVAFKWICHSCSKCVKIPLLVGDILLFLWIQTARIPAGFYFLLTISYHAHSSYPITGTGGA